MYDLDSGIAWMVGGGDRRPRRASLPRLDLRDRIVRLRGARRPSAVNAAACCTPATAS